MDVAEATAQVVLNAIELDIHEAWVTAADGGRTDATVSLDEATERATLDLASPLGPGPATVHARFTGVLNDKLHGFYRTTFTDEQGERRVAGSTQFEATHARRAFPCWDEPAFKATFGVTLGRPRGPAGDLQRGRRSPGKPLERRAGSATRSRRHDGDVDLPGRLRRRPLRGHRGRRRPRHPAAGRSPRSARATSRRSRSRPAASASSTSPTTTASPTPATSSTWWPCPTSPSAPWRTWAASRSARCCCWSTRPRSPSPSCSAWPT